MLYFSGQGEPLLHPEWYNMLEHLLNNVPSVKTVQIVSNGMTLTPKNVELLAKLPCEYLEMGISIDGASPADSEFWRKGSVYSKIKENILHAHSILHKVKFSILSTCVLPSYFNNISEYEKVEEWLVGCGNWLRSDFPFATVFSHPSMSLEDISDATCKYYEETGNVRICNRRFQWITVDAAGDVIGCGCGKGERHVLGNILEDNMYDVWLRDEKMQMRRNDFKLASPQCSCLLNVKHNKVPILVSK
jgi:sulfatase maturation enzyme AslB (radical SAM superfamily)